MPLFVEQAGFVELVASVRADMPGLQYGSLCCGPDKCDICCCYAHDQKLQQVEDQVRDATALQQLPVPWTHTNSIRSVC